MQVSNVLNAVRWKYRTQKFAKNNSPSAYHRTNLSGNIFATKAYVDNQKKMLNSNMSSSCPHNMVNFSPLASEIGWRVWGTTTNFNGFRVLTSLLSDVAQRRWTKLHDVWPSPALVHYIYTFGGSCPVKEFCQVQNSLCVQVLRSPILAALLHGTRAVGVSQTLRHSAEGATYIRQGGHQVVLPCHIF